MLSQDQAAGPGAAAAGQPRGPLPPCRPEVLRRPMPIHRLHDSGPVRSAAQAVPADLGRSFSGPSCRLLILLSATPAHCHPVTAHVPQKPAAACHTTKGRRQSPEPCTCPTRPQTSQPPLLPLPADPGLVAEHNVTLTASAQRPAPSPRPHPHSLAVSPGRGASPCSGHLCNFISAPQRLRPALQKGHLSETTTALRAERRGCGHVQPRGHSQSQGHATTLPQSSVWLSVTEMTTDKPAPHQHPHANNARGA